MGRRPPGPMKSSDKEEIILYLKDLSKRVNSNNPTAKQVEADGQVSPATIIRALGGFSEALIQADLKPSRIYNRNRLLMLSELGCLVQKLGRKPSKTEIKENLDYNARHYEKEFGSISKAIELINLGKITKNDDNGLRILTKTKSRRKYGPSIDFPGLRHAPTNELGVVFLFGMLVEKLGFSVESIQKDFPDCEAKLIRADGSYEKVKIEFEYNSKSFEQHGHDPKGCDLIVCWVHDWKDCPLEVLELSSKLEEK
jgi:hypothetical protein